MPAGARPASRQRTGRRQQHWRPWTPSFVDRWSSLAVAFLEVMVVQQPGQLSAWPHACTTPHSVSLGEHVVFLSCVLMLLYALAAHSGCLLMPMLHPEALQGSQDCKCLSN